MANEITDLFYSDGEAEPLEPTVELEEENAGEDEASEDSEEVTELSEDDDSETDAEDEAGEGEESESEEELYVELDGEEVTLTQLREYKAGYMKDADYRQKTMKLADEVKAVSAEREALTAKQSKVSDLAVELEALVAEDEEIDWAELKEYDPEKYIELKEKADKRKQKVAELKAELPKQNEMTQEQLLAESNELFSSQPQWKDKEGKLTESYHNDMKLVADLAAELGYSQSELEGINKAHHWKTLLIAARSRAGKVEKRSALDKKLKKAPLVTKPKQNMVKPQKSAADVFYG